jgi:hypothetical protein
MLQQTVSGPSGRKNDHLLCTSTYCVPRSPPKDYPINKKCGFLSLRELAKKVCREGGMPTHPVCLSSLHVQSIRRVVRFLFIRASSPAWSALSPFLEHNTRFLSIYTPRGLLLVNFIASHVQR